MRPLIVPPAKNTQARAIFGYNKEALLERLAAGIPVTAIHEELATFLQDVGYPKTTSLRAFQYWIKKHVGKTPTRPEATQQPVATTPQPPKPEKPRFFDSSQQFDVDELI